MKLAEDRIMSLPRKLVEHVFLGLYDQINVHLVKLAGFDFPEEARRHFRKELRGWFNKIQGLRFKPSNRTGSHKFYFDLLFDYPFGGVEVENMQRIVDGIIFDYDDVRPTKTAQELVDWLRTFHSELAERLHNGQDVLDMIPE
jgi:hypothetical protein